MKSINVDELKKKLDNKENIFLIDCREQTEWNQGHIPQARLFPLSNFPAFLEKIRDKNAEIILQCRSGNRSMKALEFLQDQGYGNLFNLTGGILAWIEKGHPIST